jgi:hypothetical protein
MAGVIGTRRFAYDLWGDTVNIARAHGGGESTESRARVRGDGERIGQRHKIEQGRPRAGGIFRESSPRFDSIRGPIGRKVLFGNALIPSLACQREPTITDKERAPPIAARRRPATLT